MSQIQELQRLPGKARSALNPAQSLIFAQVQEYHILQILV